MKGKLGRKKKSSRYQALKKKKRTYIKARLRYSYIEKASLSGNKEEATR